MKKYIKPGLVLWMLIVLAGLGLAQVITFPYYGKNKIMYEKFDWRHYKTDHFDIHYYVDDASILEKIAALAESAYHRLSRELRHELSAIVPILFYITTTDYEQTNLFNSAGTLGAAEPVLYRIVLQGDMPIDELQDLFEHELTHIFEYDLLWGNPGGALYAVSQPPGWIIEGFAEYNTENWSTWSEIIVRDAVLTDRIPEFSTSGQLFSRYPSPRPVDYDFGHAIFDFIETTYGKQGVTELWQAMKNTPIIGKINPVEKVFDQSAKEFSHEFKKYLRAKNKEFLLKENPEDYSYPIGPEYPLNPYYFSFTHALSPSGDIVAILTQNLKEYDLDILFVSTKDGSVIKNITRGYTSKYEYIQFNTDPTMGRFISWSQDGDKIAFFARSGRGHSLIVMDVLSGKTLKKITIPYDQPSSPAFLKNNKEILFSAFLRGTHNIYRTSLETGSTVNVTDDDLFQKAPAVSPDGKYVAYTIRIDTFDKLFLSPVDDLSKRTQLTFGRGNTVTPSFSADSKTVYFSGDMRGAYNIYSLDLKTGEQKIYTDVRTGNFLPSPLPNGSGEILFSSFNKGAFQIFRGEFEGEVEKTIAFTEVKPDQEFQRFEPIVTVEVNKDEIKTYRGIGKLYLSSRPPIDTIVSTDGSIYGGSAVSFTDLLGDYTFYIMAYQVQTYRSYLAAFINQKSRLQYSASVYHYTLFYYPYNVYYDPVAYQFTTYRDAIATRKITGVNISAYYPFSRYYRAEGSLGFMEYGEDYFDPYYQSLVGFGSFLNGRILSGSVALTGETTRFNYIFGPLSGHTFRVGVSQALPAGKPSIQNTTIEVDARKYLKISSDALFAARFYGFASLGKTPYVFYYGGNNQVRSSYYYSLVGNQAWYLNLEFRFPVLNSATTVIGQIGPVRGTLFFDVTQANLKGYTSEFYRLPENPWEPIVFSDAIGSYGFGFQFFFLGFPVHLDLARRLEIPDMSHPFSMDGIGKLRLKLWIGYDF